MAKFILSAFADEYSPVFDEQLIGLKENDVSLMEIRGVDGQNIADISAQKAKEIKRKLDDSGIGVSSIGSPIGKVGVEEPFEPHLEKYRRVLELAHILGTDRVRLFSFYIPEGKLPSDFRGAVMERLGVFLKIAQSEKIDICHENERGIYGDVAARCLDIQRYFGGAVRCVFDHANFICCGDKPYPEAFGLLKDYIFYLHIKDATADCRMVPAGDGIGRIPETLDELRKNDKTYVLTVEPHLRVFKGLDALQNQTSEGKVIDQYPTAPAAFAAAVSGIKRYI